MAFRRYHVLLCRDHAGFHTAIPVEDLGVRSADEELAAVDATPKKAVAQLKEYLQWSWKKKGYAPDDPQLKEAALTSITVRIRPEYTEEVDGTRKSFPAGEMVRIEVPCVHGFVGEEIRLVSLPTFGERFYCNRGDSMKELVTYRVRGLLKKTPQELSRYLGPEQVMLETFRVSVPDRLRRRRGKPREGRAEDADSLGAVAELLAGRGSRAGFPPAWERGAEVAELEGTLTKEGASVMLVGESGVGKTTLLAEVAARIARKAEAAGEKDPDAEGDEDEWAGAEEGTGGGEGVKFRPGTPRFWLTSGQRIVAGMKYLGQWQERCEKLVKEVSRSGGVLCVESLVDLVRLGGSEAGSSIVAFLKPWLASGELRLVVEATPSELEACRRLVPGFVELFQTMVVRPLDRERGLRVLERICAQRALNEGLEVERGLAAVVQGLYRRFLPYEAVPGGAVRFLEGFFERAVTKKELRVTKEMAVKHFIRHTGLPEEFIRDDVPLGPREIFMGLTREVIGQDDACRVVAEVVSAFKAGLNDPGKPVGVFLFCGPTGVGKTQVARTLARFCFGRGEEKDRLVRVDMSEYALPGSAYRLLGDAETGGSDLVKRVRAQPFVVLLLDEVEKAHPEVFDLILNLLDEGRFTDAFGRLTSFRSAIVIMTSNLGAQAGETIGFDEGASPGFLKAVREYFRPEFYNRIDETVIFHPLSRESILAITRKELGEIAAREGLERRGIKLEWDEAAVEHLAAAGYDKRYGARNLQRTVEERVVVPLARLLAEELPGKGTVRVTGPELLVEFEKTS